jgi:hypothetical protein
MIVPQSLYALLWYGLPVVLVAIIAIVQTALVVLLVRDIAVTALTSGKKEGQNG